MPDFPRTYRNPALGIVRVVSSQADVDALGLGWIIDPVEAAHLAEQAAANIAQPAPFPRTYRSNSTRTETTVRSQQELDALGPGWEPV